MKLVSTVTLVLLSFLTQAQDTARTEAGLKSATVYFGNGAELTHEGKVTITPNTRQIVINKLSNHLDLNSLQINLPEQVSLLAQQFNIFTPPAPKVEKNPLEAKMYDSIKAFNKVIKRLQYQVETENLTMDKTTRLIESTLLTAGNKTVVSDEALKLINALTAKVEKSRALLYKLNQEKDSIQNINSEIQFRIENLPEPIVKTEKSYGQLVLQVICRESATIPVSFSYYTQKAGWIPLYDLRVNSKTNEVKLVYKASLNQTTGLDWKQIKLTLSTGNPNWSGAAPLLQAWYLQIYTPVLYQTIQTQALTTTVTNSYNYYENKDVDEVVVTADNGYAKKRRNLAGATQNVTFDPST
ncbi:MAG: mucoidy inhibitor MuiA family protein, partial [Ferruginibacter sp.]